MKTRAEFIESLTRQKPTVYAKGENIQNIVDHPLFHIPINSVAVECDLINDPEYQALTTKTLPPDNNRVSRWYTLFENAPDVVDFENMLRELTPLYVCVPGCELTIILNAMWTATYDIDQKYQTSYHHKFSEYLRHVQKNGLILTGGISDVRGDRSKRPIEQKDPDSYLHVVSRNKEGIIVRGAKASNTGGPVANEIFVMPTRVMTEKEKDYCVAFAIPVDTRGVVYLARTWGSPEAKGKISEPLSRRFGLCESTTIFEDVFVPWERVFMCGEPEGTRSCIETFIADRAAFCGCRAGRIDAMIGAAALMAEYNGLSRASHIREKIIHMIVGAEAVHGTAYAAAMKGQRHPSGVFLPSSLEANVARWLATQELSKCYQTLMDITGGLIVTSPFEEEFTNPVTGKYIEKYLQANPEVPAEYRFRLVKLIEDMVAGKVANWVSPESILGSGPPQNQILEIWDRYNLEKQKRTAKLCCGIV